MRRVLLATSNPHKVDELREILGGAGVKLLALNDVPGASAWPEPIEDGLTFEANAQIKALAYARRSGLPCIADDSGLSVDVLGGAPGVRSARYAGASGDRASRDGANNAKLLRELAQTPDDARTARFVCAMCLAVPTADGEARVVATERGTFEGRITHAPRGANGFGYDPLLEITAPDDPCRGMTSAELTPSQKHARSHRGQAARAILPALRALVMPHSPD